MFRQVVAVTWRPGVSDEQKQGYIDAQRGLADIPEVVSLRTGADAGHFDGNYDHVLLVDFADFAAARRYVEHPTHQAYVNDWARPLVDQRVIVQHDWATGTVAGVHHLKLPVGDVVRSRDWYVAVLSFEPELEFVENGALRGVALRHREGDVRLALRQDPDRATALRGFDIVSLAVGTRDDLANVREQAHAAGATPGPVVQGRVGWSCDLTDPDGIVVRLYTHERHG
jgi:catechol 2,3-dioxygenase-like lactoylglutathione lyase family enzyme